MVKKIAICLLRNDLRYHDNEVLLQGHQTADYVFPVYVFDHLHYKGTHHFGFPKTGAYRTKFLIESVEDLRKTLQSRGSNLMIFQGRPKEAVANILKNLNGSALTLICQAEVTKEETDVEKNIAEACKEQRANFIKIWGSTLYHRSDLPFPVARTPDNYTAFRKEMEARAKVRPEVKMPEKLKPVPELGDQLRWGDTPTYQQLGVTEPKAHPCSAFPFQGGETSGLQRLQSYLWDTDAVARYKETRNGLVGVNYSTKFSPWLAHGCLSPRRVHWEIGRYERERTKNDSTYWVTFEMIWRDYMRFVCNKFGDRVFYPTGLKGQPKTWKKDMRLFELWKTGRTGVPFVDANMRELLETGWMSNRGRQNVASFLVKDLHLDWRLGAEWFESLLVDHDVCSNYGNWNYVAGIGNDPREDRKFNMIKQAMDYDSDGVFVRQWVTELKAVPGSRVHMPWTLAAADLQRCGLELGIDYPRPVIMAPEWSRHSAGGPRSAGPKGGPRPPPAKKTGQQRGIDFYFKGKP